MLLTGGLTPLKQSTGYERQQPLYQGRLATMERLVELVKGYSFEDVLNIDELGLIFKTLPQKGLAEKGKKGRDGKQSKKQCTVALFVAANGSKVCDSIVVRRSKKPGCFKK